MKRKRMTMQAIKTSKKRRVIMGVVLLMVFLCSCVLIPQWRSGLAFADASDSQDAEKKSDATKKSGDVKKSGSGGPVSAVRVGEADERELVARWDVIGRLKEVRSTTVGVGQQGRVIEMAVEEGDRVVGGKSVLAKIDQTFAKIELLSAVAQLEQAKAAIAKARSQIVESKAASQEAKADLEKAHRDVDRYKLLLAQRSAERREYDDALSFRDAKSARFDVTKATVVTREAELLTAEKAVLVAEAEKLRVEETLKRFSVKVPGVGEWIVVRKIMEVGQWVQKGAPVVDLVSVGMIDAIVDVPERFVNSIQVGDKVSITVGALKMETTGKVVALIPVAADAARTFPVKIRLDDAGGKLKSGMSVKASIPTGRQQKVLTVPRDGVLFSARGSVVWIAVSGKAMPVAVDVLFSDGDRYVVKQAIASQKPGLGVGATVVIEGGERLMFPGQPVRILPPEAGRKRKVGS
jgi:membrane fusion protein, multidrug efflux system